PAFVRPNAGGACRSGSATRPLRRSPSPPDGVGIVPPVLVFGLQEYRTRFVIHRRSKSSTVIAHAARRARRPLPSWRRVAGATMQAGRSGLIRDWSAGGGSATAADQRPRRTAADQRPWR